MHQGYPHVLTAAPLLVGGSTCLRLEPVTQVGGCGTRNHLSSFTSQGTDTCVTPPKAQQPKDKIDRAISWDFPLDRKLTLCQWRLREPLKQRIRVQFVWFVLHGRAEVEHSGYIYPDYDSFLICCKWHHPVHAHASCNALPDRAARPKVATRDQRPPARLCLLHACSAFKHADGDIVHTCLVATAVCGGYRRASEPRLGRENVQWTAGTCVGSES